MALSLLPPDGNKDGLEQEEEREAAGSGRVAMHDLRGTGVTVLIAGVEVVAIVLELKES